MAVTNDETQLVLPWDCLLMIPLILNITKSMRMFVACQWYKVGYILNGSKHMLKFWGFVKPVLDR